MFSILWNVCKCFMHLKLIKYPRPDSIFFKINLGEYIYEIASKDFTIVNKMVFTNTSFLNIPQIPYSKKISHHNMNHKCC